MNNILAKKILEKLSLKDLYNEIKDSPDMIYNLGTILVFSQKALFCEIIKDLVENTIKSGDVTLTKFFKTEIINMDGPETLSVNAAVKRRVAQTPASSTTLPSKHAAKKAEADPCSSGRGGRPNC